MDISPQQQTVADDVGIWSSIRLQVRGFQRRDSIAFCNRTSASIRLDERMPEI
jgi:hypothetical protein